MLLATPGYWIFMATGRPSTVTARCTWPSEAAANGRSSNSASRLRQLSPSSFLSNRCAIRIAKKTKQAGLTHDRKEASRAYLALPCWHKVGAHTHLLEDATPFVRYHRIVCRRDVRQRERCRSCYRSWRPRTLNAEHLAELERGTAHPTERLHKALGIGACHKNGRCAGRQANGTADRLANCTGADPSCERAKANQPR